MARNNKKSRGFNCEHPGYSRCPICCIVPPHILENVAVNGNPEQRSWAFQTLNVSAQLRGRRNVIGSVSFAPSPGVKRRTIYDAKNSENLPGILVRGEGDPPSSDPAVNEAYDYAGATYDLFHEIFDRNSIDDKGLRLDSTVHYGVKYENAFWNGDQMVYGDGDGQLFQRFTKSIDVIAHELTHGVTQYEAGLQYYGEPGALNESFSDVFGALVKQKSKNQTVEQADWIIGEGLLAPTVKGVGIRSLKAPGTAYDDPVMGKDPQPAVMKDKYTGTEDNAGVHINSGIANYAFYLAAMEIGGYAWEKSGKIWYITLRDRLRANANFKAAATATIKVASELYGNDSKEQKAVQNAWQKVGVIK
ncbi:MULTISPECIES: M4 family metallopeptidase [unclassified Tolypothrix]|uniref:M4 family metallopeptidase n=1 Tax=unclassified Tolypothrix TaxID=2649714 RepID=UPI0005EAB64A|nr:MULTISPECIES: M4 family metallopeptidase [unclassified Tolypothrix]BAY89671.1 peptidase M4, thermolysin [Microchaete diplosiphon NIES-3275]EKE97630.1 thermolysin metallopeptidase, alpha-helical domain protein [Tolypothrix sp. PCC 7601]MBE9083209.1 peptidase M4 family protein [Tolypothrix sp. LEGE 11397]UYD23941.1 peptidase M4 family protein [Tolypothrix sp. PCC 7712]UYD33833.1 peptidase M4 family protein [Tolypothrix sp. PCC 7601]